MKFAWSSRAEGKGNGSSRASGPGGQRRTFIQTVVEAVGTGWMRVRGHGSGRGSEGSGACGLTLTPAPAVGAVSRSGATGSVWSRLQELGQDEACFQWRPWEASPGCGARRQQHLPVFRQQLMPQEGAFVVVRATTVGASRTRPSSRAVSARRVVARTAWNRLARSAGMVGCLTAQMTCPEDSMRICQEGRLRESAGAR